jgi:circadian clock protein KaiB
MSNSSLTQLPEPPQVGDQILQLYVAGSTPQSSRAITNIKTICETHLKDHYDLTVVDLYEQPDRAHHDLIDVTPTLIRFWPLPVRRLVGSLAHTELVLQALGLPLAAHIAA